RHTEMMAVAQRRARRHGWDLAVCVTDLPLRDGRQPIVADMSGERRVVVVSLPAFGVMSWRRRVRNVVAQLIADMYGIAASPGDEHRGRRLPVLSRRFRRVEPEQEGVDVRMLASRGKTRLLMGMVRDNRPWRLVLGMTGPLVGAFAFSAFYLINTTVWELAASMGPLRLLGTVLGSIGIMVVWLIVYHHLWEPTREARTHDQAVLFNASTVLTLLVGVGCMFVFLYAANLVIAGVVLTPGVLGQYVGTDPGITDYAAVTLLITAAGTVAGAIGSGFESEDSVRSAAFSYRERERRQAMHDESESDDAREGGEL
ncbi:hypothetical protein, partial [Nocardiopsis halotolerans]|uniref:hypothetical protein n=1 Tax=Nocardiopsis halotolerans TaxID=124252 RepID=UPI0003722CDC